MQLDTNEMNIRFVFSDEKEIKKAESRFIKFLKKNWKFSTVNGAINMVTSITKEEIHIQTKASDKGFVIPRQKIREAIQFFFSHRTAIRKDLEKFTRFTSALLGILSKIFESAAYIKRLEDRICRLSLIGVRFFASGLERDPAVRKIVKKVGGKFLLLNYFYIRNDDNWLKFIEEDDFYVLIDSGAFSVYKQMQKRAKAEEEDNLFQLDLLSFEDLPMIDLDEWARFIEKHKDHPRILGFFNLDVIEEPEQTRENFKKLKERIPTANIYPVWQFTDSFEELEKLAEQDYDLIGIGGMVPYLSNRKGLVQRKLDKIFQKFPYVNFHFLGGANEMLVNYPFFTADSSAFLNARKSEDQRQIYLSNGYRIEAPDEMTTEEIMEQNLSFLFSLESLYKKSQRSMFDVLPTVFAS